MLDQLAAPLYIDGEFREASNRDRFEVIYPGDESVVGQAADATADDVASAVAAARRAFDDTPWSTDHDFRVRCLRQLQEALREQVESITSMQTSEAGIPAAVAALAVGEIEEMGYAIDLAESFEWEEEFEPYEAWGMRSVRRVRYEPYGVVAAITPWNSPFILNNWKTIPALASGNTVVLKTAPETPISGAMLARAIHEHTDIPPGVFNLLSSNDNAVGGDLLTADPRVDMFHFTGSTAVGERISKAAAVGVRKVVLELGGKSANIILDDADLDFAIPYSVGLCMMTSGQGCILPTRLVVHASHYGEVLERLEAVGRALPWGDPRDASTVVGPLIRADQVERVRGLVERAVAAGSRAVVGGKRGDRGGRGFWFEPTILADVDENSEIAQTEVFGPVLSVLKYDGGDAEAVRIANNSTYGLSGYVQTRDLDRASWIANRIRTGTVNIGPAVYYSPNVPFGGYRKSGIGREHGVDGFREFLQSKTIATPAP
jgi:aldehyde dehydrogenase (NAD+)